MVDLVTFGHLTLDDLVLDDGRVLRHTLGGGALYSAVGAQIRGCAVGIHSCVGADYPAEHRRRIEQAGLDLTGVTTGAAHSLALWLLMEGASGKQQLPKLTSGHVAELDGARGPLPRRYRGARGFHVAPALPAAQAAAIRSIREVAPQAIITLDIWTESFFDTDPYQQPGFLARVDAFLPSDKEVKALWGLADLRGTLPYLAAQGPRAVAVKLGEAGSLVYDGDRNTAWLVPCVPVAAVDTTGAGDAYCGGFLAGLVGTGDPLDAALWGTVAASFAVQDYGAQAGMGADPVEVQRRLEALRPRVKPA